MTNPSEDLLLEQVAEALFASWFPNGNEIDPEPWREIALFDAAVALSAIRSSMATQIESYARENHRHVDVGGLCPVNRSSADTCDLVAAYRNAARLVRGE